MAPLPENSTNVYFVDYAYQGNAHTMQFRYGASTGLPDFIARVNTFLTQLGPLLDASWDITGARYRVAGSDVSLPTGLPTRPARGGGIVAAPAFPRFVSFVGRGNQTGRRVRLYVYGVNVAVPADYRFQPGEVANLGTAVAALNEPGPNKFLTIGGDEAVWQPYVNTGYNSYLERRARL